MSVFNYIESKHIQMPKNNAYYKTNLIDQLTH